MSSRQKRGAEVGGAGQGESGAEVWGQTCEEETGEGGGAGGRGVVPLGSWAGVEQGRAG